MKNIFQIFLRQHQKNAHRIFELRVYPPYYIQCFPKFARRVVRRDFAKT